VTVKTEIAPIRRWIKTYSQLALVLLTVLLPIACMGQLANASWPKFRANNLNTGVGVAGGLNGTQKWAYKLGMVDFASAVVGPDGTIYTGAFDGYLHAINPDGTKKWNFATGAIIQGTPAVAKDGTIYIGSHDNYFYAVKPDGTLLWSHWMANVVDSSPAIGPDGTIYVGCMDNNLYAFNPDGTKKWTFPTTNSTWSSPAIGPDGTIYIGSWDSNLYAINSDGTKKWAYLTGGAIDSSPAIGSDGTIYVGSFDNALHAIASDGTQKWSYRTGGQIVSSPAIGADGTLYVGSNDGNFYAVNPAGSLKWYFRTLNGIPSSPALGSDGTIYFGSWDGNCYAVNPDGSKQWTYVSGNSIYSSPAIGADGTIYVASNDGNLYAIGTGPNGVSVASITVNPVGVVGGLTSTGTVTLAKVAPAGGELVNLTSSDASAVPPSSVMVAAGSTTATFTIDTNPVSSTKADTITASVAGSSVTAILQVTPAVPTGIILFPTEVVGHTDSKGTVYLNGIAPAGGATLTLTSSNSAAIVPASITVQEGQPLADFTIATSPVTSQVVTTITATYAGISETATLTIDPPTLSGVGMIPTFIAGGNIAQGTVTLTGPAPTGGLQVSLTSNNSIVSIPTSVTIAAGQVIWNFSASTTAVTSQKVVTITAKLGSVTKTTTLTVSPPVLQSISFNPSTVLGGAASTGTVTLTGPAPKGGTVVKLAGTKGLATLPASVSIVAGKSSATFIVKTSAVSVQKVDTVVATLGANSASADITVSPPSLVSLSLSPSNVKAGASSTGTVKLSGIAPVGGIAVVLSSSEAMATVPAKATIAAGKSSATFSIKTTKAGTKTTATITGASAGVTKTANLTIS